MASQTPNYRKRRNQGEAKAQPLCSEEQRVAAVRATLTLRIARAGGFPVRMPSARRNVVESDPCVITTPTTTVIRGRSFTSSVRRGDGPVGGPSASSTHPPEMKSGDVLVSQPSARADMYEINVVPAGARTTKVRYEDGLETGRQLARDLSVDGWFTCDHIHVLRIAQHRI